MFKQKSVWAQLGMGAKGRDANVPSAPAPVSEDAQAKNTRSTARLVEFAPQNRSRDQLPQRPSTSAGPASSFTKRKNAEKRETKDDLHFHFNPLAAHGKGTTFYNFPLPGALPTPATTPRSSPPPPRKASMARPSTPDSMEIAPVKMIPPPMEIGMALGSPAHPPTIYQPDPSDSYARNESPDHMDGSADGWVNSPPMLKRKPNRWKTFGGLFGGKKHTQAFYQLQPDVPQPPAEQHVQFEEPRPSSEKPSKSQGRGQTSSEKKSKKSKSDMKRANTAPLNFDFADANRYQNQTPEITLEGERLNDNGSTHTYSGGLLDIDIPSVHMERYSVMFSGVLQKSGTTQSSLLARRQATLDKLKTVNEAIASKEQELEAVSRHQRPRRASSPQAKSPAFSLFPSTPSRAREGSPSPYRSNLQRSNTSPAMLSPSRLTFAPGPENEAHAKILAAAAAAAAKENPEKRNLRAEVRIPNLRKREPKPEPEPERESEQIPDSPTIVSPNPNPNPNPTPKWSTEESHLTLDSSSDAEAEECEVEDTYDPAPLPMKPVLPEPHWQMITPANGKGHAATSSTSGSTTSRSDHSTSTSASSIMTSPSVISTPQFSKQALQSPPTGRSRSATTTAPPSTSGRLRSATTSSPSQIPSRSPNTHTAFADEDEQLRLKNAADVSIARQISVSRQQRQLLVPIKSALKQPKNPNLNIERSAVQNFPVPASGIGAIGTGRVASPLGAVAVAAQVERERAGSPLADRGERERVPRDKKTTERERLVEGVKPVTPTLVVVGGSQDEKEKLWQGATQQHQTAKNSPVGLAERRRGNGNGHLHLSTTGEIKVGLAVEAAQAKELQHRKSERVVVERISVT